MARGQAPSEGANGATGGNASAGAEGHDRRPAGSRESGPRKCSSWRLQRLWGCSEESSGNSASPPSRGRHFYSRWKSPWQTPRGLAREEARARRRKERGKLQGESASRVVCEGGGLMAESVMGDPIETATEGEKEKGLMTADSRQEEKRKEEE